MWKSLRRKLFPPEFLSKGRRRIAIFVLSWCLALAALVYVGRTVPRRIAFSRTHSLDYRFFFYKRHFTEKELVPGAYVIFPIHTHIVEACNPCRVVKRIGCDENEYLASSAGGYFYCGQRFLGQAKTHSKKGLRVDHFVHDGLVPKGKFFAVGDCPDSFDSRYIGFMEKKHVEAIAVPIF